MLFLVFELMLTPTKGGEIKVKLEYTQPGNVQAFYATDTQKDFSEENSAVTDIDSGKSTVDLDFAKQFSAVRLDLGSLKHNEIKLYSIELRNGAGTCQWSANELKTMLESGKLEINQLELISNSESDVVLLKTTGEDPYIILNNGQYQSLYTKPTTMMLSGVLALLFALIFVRDVRLEGVLNFCKNVYKEKWLLVDLSVNDFKARYAGTLFGSVWAFIQPVCTIIVFWFVFQVGFKNPPISNVPYFLWMASGLIPWFFFSDGWNMASTSLVEYSYLVKKVVFKVELLPLVKILSTLYVHVFFVGFIVVLFLCNGIWPGIRLGWLLYYMFAAIVLVTGLSFITSSLLVFYRDLQPIMGIMLQFLMWLTPIMWSVSMFPSSLMEFFKLNPLYYVINGYRYVLIGDMSYVPTLQYSVYFWFATGMILLLGVNLFERVKVHFADVL